MRQRQTVRYRTSGGYGSDEESGSGCRDDRSECVHSLAIDCLV
jgi:hypothetical protein